MTSFREKPDEKTAHEFVDRGNFFWNAGMFFWRASSVLDLMRHHQPKTATLLAGLPPFGSRQFASKLAASYPLCQDISVDYGVIEKADQVAGIALDDIGWNDVGSWEAVYGLAAKDKNGNASKGDLIVRAARITMSTRKRRWPRRRRKPGDCRYARCTAGRESQQESGRQQAGEDSGCPKARRFDLEAINGVMDDVVVRGAGLEDLEAQPRRSGLCLHLSGANLTLSPLSTSD